ncbi:hypothetical protein Nepgr_003512 [Nepenthes gracilis]|uniref:Uncharacterized protein n=1 Tax=Nepenthes gracilis TaxID=150966 RepID=A0AAD3RZM3_NEPGR|nr:hypothetical protein Nepgr_003512 [Nepenthes gracilis]
MINAAFWATVWLLTFSPPLLLILPKFDEAADYEKAVFDAVFYLVSEDRDDNVALELHAKTVHDFPKDLVSLKRAQILCFYMGQPRPSLDLVQQVTYMACLLFLCWSLAIWKKLKRLHEWRLRSMSKIHGHSIVYICYLQLSN